MRAFIKFNQGIMKMPAYWQLRLMVLITFNLVIPLVLLSHVEAQVVVGALVARRAEPDDIVNASRAFFEKCDSNETLC